MLLEDLFKVAIKEGASDLHLVVGKPPMLRVAGELIPVGKLELTKKNIEDFVASILTHEQEERFRREKELDFAVETKGSGRFRVNIFFEKGEMSLAARVISRIIPKIKELGLPEVVKQFTEFPHGLILVTGPTGSGKSTTLASIIEEINIDRKENIITLEDPIEYLFEGKKSIIRQRQLGIDMLSFAEGLKHILRQDPDVIMVGEMRDLETIAAALTLAETGHLVFATLHTWSAAQTIDRIVDSFPSHQQQQIRLQLALTLRGIITQQLLAKKGGGQVAAFEILVNNPAIANLIRENKIQQIRAVMETSSKEGMITLSQNLKKLLKDGVIEKATAESLIVGERLE
jgi:twitching motility protein PilT